MATSRGHLCDPKTMEKVYSCVFCGMDKTDAFHVCKPMLDKLEFVCEQCGRVSVSQEFLCQPKKLNRD